MITKKIKISNDGSGMEEALKLVEDTSESINLNRKERFYLRLLTEEMLSMIRAVTENFNAEFFINVNESDRDFTLNLEAKSDLDYRKRRELISVSTQGKNTAQRGIMEKIREIIEAGLTEIGDSFELQSEYGTGMFSYGTLGMLDRGLSETIYSWSMQKYKSDVESERSKDSDEWDELEKSIIANIADDVKVGVTRNNIKLEIRKKF